MFGSRRIPTKPGSQYLIGILNIDAQKHRVFGEFTRSNSRIFNGYIFPFSRVFSSFF